MDTGQSAEDSEEPVTVDSSESVELSTVDPLY
jgi:hypothetical protein